MPAFVSHMVTVPSGFSPPAASFVPSGEKHSDQTLSPLFSCNTFWLLSTSQMITLLSSPPLAIRVSSGDMERHCTQRRCPSNGTPTNFPFSTSQIRTVQSYAPVTTRRPSLKNAAARTRPVCPCIVRVGSGGTTLPLSIRYASFTTSGTPDMLRLPRQSQQSVVLEFDEERTLGICLRC